MSDSSLSVGFFRQAELFAALGDETRLSLLDRLRRVNNQSITQLADGSHLTRQAVTKHLQVLEKVQLVKSVHKGRETRYEFNPTTIESLKQYLDLVSGQWEKKLHDLKVYLEE